MLSALALNFTRITCYKSPDPFSSTVVGQTDFDVITGRCVVSDWNLEYAILVRRETLSDDEVKVCLLQ